MLRTSALLIKTIAPSKVLLDLRVNIIAPTPFNNAESWDLLASAKKELEQVKYQIVSSLFNLPFKTPTTAIVHTFGTLHTKTDIDKLLFLRKILRREENHWTNMALKTLNRRNNGWHRN